MPLKVFLITMISTALIIKTMELEDDNLGPEEGVLRHVVWDRVICNLRLGLVSA